LDTYICEQDPRATRFRGGGDCDDFDRNGAGDRLPCLARALWEFQGRKRCTRHTAAALGGASR